MSPFSLLYLIFPVVAILSLPLMISSKRHPLEKKGAAIIPDFLALVPVIEGPKTSKLKLPQL